VTVGDAIVQARILGPDKPLTLGPPTGLSYAVVAVGANPIPATTYYLKVSQFNLWGESIPSAESSGQVVGANHSIQVTFTPDPTAVRIRIYYGLTAGGENAYFDYFPTTYPPTPGITSGLFPATFTLNQGGSVTPPCYEVAGTGYPATASTAYLPDQDGKLISAAQMYMWLNNGLRLAANYTGGIRDVTGVGSINAVPMYTLTGLWKRLTHGWYDGYVMEIFNKRNFFYANSTNGYSWGAAVSYNAERAIAEVFPQPQRTSGSTTNGAQINIGDTTITLTSSANFVLPFGLAAITGNPSPGNAGYYPGAPRTEIIAYSAINATPQMTNVTRALGGTPALSFANGGATITELNIRFAGLRKHFPNYVQGMASQTLQIPNEWHGPLSLYLLSYFREAEQDREGAAQLRAEFETQIRAMRASDYPGPFQMGAATGREIFGGSYGGGWLLP